MTDKKENNVKPLFKGMKVDTGEASEPRQDIIDKLKELLVEAESGELRELAFSCIYSDKSFRHDFVGEIKEFLLMQNLLRTAEVEYFDTITSLSLLGFNFLEEDL